MSWLASIATFFKSLPAVASLFGKWIDLKGKELPIKIEKHEEREIVREVDAKWDAEKRDDKGRKRNDKRDKKEEKKKAKKQARDARGRFIKKKK